MSQNETGVQKSIQEYIRNIGGYCFKVHGSIYMRAGIPDIICCVKGQFVGIEVKDGDNKASALQEAHIRQIKKAGGLAFVAYNINDVKDELIKLKLID